MDSVEIIQQNRRGPGRLASRSIALAMGLALVSIFIVAILVILVARSLTGRGAVEDVVVFFLLPPTAVLFLLVAAFELSAALPRRLLIGAGGIHIHFSPWSLRPRRHLHRVPGQKAEILKLRQSNYATYPSGRVSHAPIRSSRLVIRYGRRWFGPVDDDQIEALVVAINDALVRTAPCDHRARFNSSA